jgi:hypothetical protein
MGFWKRLFGGSNPDATRKSSDAYRYEQQSEEFNSQY